MPNHEAAEKITKNSIRFLFIDGDHTKTGVEKDISLFFEKLTENAIVVFDDYDNSFPGLVEAVNELLKTAKIKRKYRMNRMLIIRM